jgi:hypothetical protein
MARRVLPQCQTGLLGPPCRSRSSASRRTSSLHILPNGIEDCPAELRIVLEPVQHGTLHPFHEPGAGVAFAACRGRAIASLGQG